MSYAEPITYIYQDTGETVSLSDGDISRGKKLFQRHCQYCHSLSGHGNHGIGPNLMGIIDRQIAGETDYKYSYAMKSFDDETWTLDNLFRFLDDPRRFMPGNKMGFTGLQRVQDRLDLLAYIKTVTGSEMDQYTLEARYKIHDTPYGNSKANVDYKKRV